MDFINIQSWEDKRIYRYETLEGSQASSLFQKCPLPNFPGEMFQNSSNEQSLRKIVEIFLEKIVKTNKKKPEK